MPKKSATQEKSLSLNEYHRLEIQEVFYRTRNSENVRTQVATFCLTVNITILGFAFSSQKSGLVFAAAMVLVFWVLADLRARRNMGVLYFRGLQLERMYAPDKDAALLHIYLESTSSRKDWVEYLENIAGLQDSHQRIKALRTPKLSSSGFVLPAIGVILELLFGFYLLFQGWSLF